MAGSNNVYAMFMKVYPTQTTPSPEVTSKATPIIEEDVTADVKILTEKLSASLRSIKAKEDLVKQHAKVAEEAVTGTISKTSLSSKS